MSERSWRTETKPFARRKQRAPDLKVKTQDMKADIVFLEEPKFENFGYKKDGSEDIRFWTSVGYLGGNALCSMYNRDEKKKYEVPAQVGEVYTLWFSNTIKQGVANIWPDEDILLSGKSVQIGRHVIEGGPFGAYLGYSVAEIEGNSALIERIFERHHEMEDAGPPDEDELEEVKAGNQDLEVAYQLVSTSLQALTNMSFPQIQNFLNNRRSSGLMKSELSASEVANYCVSKDSKKFEIVADGDVKSLVLKS